MDRKASIRGSLLLLLGSVIWGAAFTAQRMGMDNIGPFYFTGIRMLLAGLAVSPVIVWNDRRKRRHGTAPAAAGRKQQRTGGLMCGIFLFAASVLQQTGIITTSAGKTGFITALYVVLVPVAGWILFRHNPGRIIWLGVGTALVALYLLCMPARGFEIEPGDLLVLGCAICFTGQILCVDHFAPKVDGLRLSRDQFLVTGGLSMAVAVMTETISPEGIISAAIPILYTGVMSGGVGYTLQIIGQRNVNPTLASLIMCLESVFAVLTGAAVLGETLSAREAAGCALMFAAVILAQLSPVINERRNKRRLAERRG